MSDTERWSVTYTKQINKKRAVYQDGFLEIQYSNLKAMLYDEFDKLLVSRVMKIEDVIRPGETLTFSSYLVDIGEKCGGHEPVPTSNLQVNGKKVTVKIEKLDGQKSQKNSTSVGKRPTFVRPTFVTKKPSVISLSPSQKIIRDFKKSEMNKYGSSPSCLDVKTSSTTQWQVMYTTQITQKAKKFHDGVLRFIDHHGVLGRKVMLYDEYERLLDSKFLKKEVINTGEKLAFDSYLVEIGDKCGDNKHESASDNQGKDKKVFVVTGSLLNLKSQSNTNSFDRKTTFWNNKAPVINLSPSPEIITEWQVMYTTQITQKAKKFHDGVLQLVVREGSQMGQVTLLAEDGTVLGHRHLKISEDVRTGATLDMPKYLIEVGERRDDASSSKVSEVQTSSIDGTALIGPLKTVPICIRKKTSPRKLTNLDCSSSMTRDTESSPRIPANEPKRSANAILSILRKPVVQEDFKPMVEDPLQLHISDIHSDMKTHAHSKDLGRGLADVPRDTIVNHNCNTETIKSETVEIPDDEKCIMYEVGKDLPENLSGLCTRSEATDAMKPIVIEECVNHFSYSAVKALKVVTTAFDPENQTSIASIFPTVSNVKVKLENTLAINLCPEIRNETTAAATIDSSFSNFAKAKSLYENSSKFYGAASVDGVALNAWTSRGTSGVQESIIKHTFLAKTDEFPSFDLGF